MSDRKGRKDELLKSARRRLAAGEDPTKPEPELGVGSGRQVMYRGRVVRTSGDMPHNAAVARQEARVALEKIKALYHDGLISREDAEAKRTEILDAL